jgi:YspA, cpYpsA-related SLOG family
VSNRRREGDEQRAAWRITTPPLRCSSTSLARFARISPDRSPVQVFVDPGGGEGRRRPEQEIEMSTVADFARTSAADHPVGLCLAIVGSRDFPELHRVRRFVQRLPAGIILVSGGARGVDRCAAAVARARGLEIIEYLADWDRYGRRRAGFIRNRQVVRRCDRMVAFWDGASTGTDDAIALARTPWTVRAAGPCRSR